ncbi:hypothetical protein [Clavibacter sp. VKM Ac-2872]|uniref:hypothetical protein n=1 Tax=Clavibacter sp. VKM Ac-2872 TaxID=2783812 RepID=UPI00188C0B27|nr:hypothetical protein [Clavibacter sp. VKM Ac-2872]MBF4625555.1 hypothetical protein [Clavibacter sp. VKM Ac-2872]
MDGPPAWTQLVLGFFGLGGVAALITAFATRRRDRTTEIQDRFESTSELAKYMRDEVAKEVERQLTPIKEQLAVVTAESHEMNEAVRSREVRLWRWETGGRVGVIPQLSFPILERLGLNGLFDPPTTSTTVPEGPTT